MSQEILPEIINRFQSNIFTNIFFSLSGGSLLFGLLCYILRSAGMYSLAKRRGIHHPWLAWITIGRSWLLGCISDQYRYIARNERKRRRTILLVLSLLVVAAEVGGLFITVAGFSSMLYMGNQLTESMAIAAVAEMLLPTLVIAVLSIILLVVTYIAYYDLFCSCTPDSCVVFLILGILFPVLLPFFVFAIRKKDGGMPPRRGADIPDQPQWNPGREDEM